MQSEQTAITIRALQYFTPEMKSLRRGGFGSAYADVTSEDEFDGDSVHITASIGATPIGMVRMTRGAKSILGRWSTRDGIFQPEPNNVEMTRAVVDPSVQRIGILKLLALENSDPRA